MRSEPQPQRLDSAPEPPDFLSLEAATEWRRLAPELIRLGLLTGLDLAVFSAYCAAWGRWAEAERLIAEVGTLTVTSARGHETPHPLLRLSSAAANDALRFGSEFGLTPCSLARLDGCEPPPSGKFAGLLGPAI